MIQSLSVCLFDRRSGVFKGLIADGIDRRRSTSNAAHSARRVSRSGAARCGKNGHPSWGAILARSGEPITSFVYVEEGEVEVINPYTNERHVPFTLGSAQFMGEISLLNGGAGSLTMRAVRETRVIEVQRGPMLTLS